MKYNFNIRYLSVRVTATDGSNESAFDDFNLTVNETGTLNLIEGNGQNNTLIGSPDADRILGKGGDDLLRGKEGNDELVGGNGWDDLFGNQGDDLLQGGNGSDFLDGGVGNDTLEGGDGRDFLYGWAGDDILKGGVGNDDLYGEGGNDHLDTLAGDGGNDELRGGTGSDIYQLNRGDGHDLIRDANTFSPDIDQIQYGAGITKDDVWFVQNGNHLDVYTLGSDDRTQIRNWYNQPNRHIEEFHTQSGAVLNGEDVQTLVDAMAAFGAPVNGEVNLTPSEEQQIQTLIAATWQ